MAKITDTEEIAKAYKDGFDAGYKQFDIDRKQGEEKYRREIVEKRVKVRKIIEEGLRLAIVNSIESIGHSASYEWCVNHWSSADFATDTLGAWIEDEDGDIAIDRLVTLIMY